MLGRAEHSFTPEPLSADDALDSSQSFSPGLEVKRGQGVRSFVVPGLLRSSPGAQGVGDIYTLEIENFPISNKYNLTFSGS